jgi:DNA-binding MarR family transcriptional regulator
MKNDILKEKLDILARTAIDVALLFKERAQKGISSSTEVYSEIDRLQRVAQTFLANIQPNKIEVVERVSDIEKKCLETLAGEPDIVYTMKSIVDETKLTLAQVRRSVRSLAKKGLAELSRAYDEENGTFCGSGYSATEAGVALIHKFEKEAEVEKRIESLLSTNQNEKNGIQNTSR